MKRCLGLVIALLMVDVSAGQPEPPRCCISRQFEASLTDLTTIKSNQIALQFLSMDFDRNIQANNGFILHTDSKTTTTTYKTIMDFNKHMQYSIPVDDPSKCFPRAISRPMPQRCVPADAQYLGSAYLGPLNALPYDGWRYQLAGTTANLTMAFSTQGCVPLVESVFGDIDGDPVDFTFLFAASSAEIKDPSVFDIPPSCNQAA